MHKQCTGLNFSIFMADTYRDTLLSVFQEYNNTSLAPLLEKRNWKKIMLLIRKDLEGYKLPSATYISQLIRKAILCEETRVSKDVQSESIALLEELMKSYPPQNGNGKDPSVRYYKEILDNVSDYHMKLR